MSNYVSIHVDLKGTDTIEFDHWPVDGHEHGVIRIGAVKIALTNATLDEIRALYEVATDAMEWADGRKVDDRD